MDCRRERCHVQMLMPGGARAGRTTVAELAPLSAWDILKRWMLHTNVGRACFWNSTWSSTRSGEYEYIISTRPLPRMTDRQHTTFGTTGHDTLRCPKSSRRHVHLVCLLVCCALVVDGRLCAVGHWRKEKGGVAGNRSILEIQGNEG